MAVALALVAFTFGLLFAPLGGPPRGSVRGTHSRIGRFPVNRRVFYRRKPLVQEHSAFDFCQFEVQGRCSRLIEGPLSAFKIATDARTVEVHFAFGAEAIAQINVSGDLRQRGIDRVAVRILEPTALALEVAANARGIEVHFAFGTEALVQINGSLDLRPRSIERRAALRILEASALAREIAPNARTIEVHFAFGAKAIAQKKCPSIFAQSAMSA